MPGDLRKRVLERLNAVQDPCSLASAMPIGLADMGLVVEARISEAADAEGRHDVALVLRVTAPGCMYMPFMDRSIRATLSELPGVGEISTVWEPTADWTPADMAKPVQRRLAAAREGRRQEYLARQARGETGVERGR